VYKIKQSLDAVGYAGYFYQGRPLTLEEIIERAAKFGFDAVDVWPHRPIAFPMDVSKDRRKRLLDLARSKGIQFAAVEAITNFMRSDHVLTPRQEKELLFVRECCELARDLDCPIVRILAGFIGYFWHEHWDKGYGTTAMHSRSIEVSTQDDYLKEWEFVRAGIREAGVIAKDYGITLALQSHPPVTNCIQDGIDMVDEVGLDNVKMGLDLPLFERQDDEFIRETVLKVGKRMAHSHTLGISFKQGLGAVYGFDELPPGEGRENWIPFFKACREIGYDGYFAYEQCSPVVMPGHKKPTIEEMDRRHQKGLQFLKSLEEKI
jgi:sugar phosphate isomerase/epimerase